MAAEFDLQEVIGEFISSSCLCVETVEDAHIVIKQFEKSTTTKFTSFSSPKDFGVTDVKSKVHRIRWEHGDRSPSSNIPFDGVPFINLAIKIFECQHGPDRNLGNKKKFAEKRQDTPYAKHCFLKHDTKKFGCKAKILLYEVMKFPEYKIQVDSKKRRVLKSSAVRRDLSEGSPVQQRRFYLCLPSTNDHTGHNIGEERPQHTMMSGDCGRVMFVGMNCLDISTTCEGYPEEDSEHDVLDMLWVRGGNASNSSTACALLGGNTQYMGNLADTYELQFFKESFQEVGIDFSDCPVVKSQCPRTLVLINATTGSRTLMYYGGDYPELSAKDFRDRVELLPGKYRWIHFEGRPNVADIEQMIKYIQDFNRTASETDRIKMSLEFEKVRRNDAVHLMKEVDVTFVSKDFAMHKGFPDMQSACVGFKHFIKPGGCVVCAWGEKGAAAKPWNQPVAISTAFPPEKLVNTTAAGDTFNAATVLALTKGMSVHEAITYACRVAGAKCGMRGFERLKEFALS